ncbi:HAD family hydrolase [Fundicoccus sp. Sow4_F4]|uniref:HAD family hydrolase n=1 Tax=Fundicoccus sp. Sow4_F4 TaxID=3438783 RepID=UPI003F9047E7
MKTIIFDMDGVIVDSEYTYLESKTQILKDADREKPLSYQYQFMGTTYEFMWQKMKDELALPEDISFYISEMNRIREEMIQRDGVRAIKCAQKLIMELHSQGYELAVASSSPKKEIIRNLTELGLIEYFKVLVSGEEVERSKPNPDVFLRAAELIEADPTNCIVIEDTKNGALAAKAAGMYCFGFANPDYPTQDLSMTDEIVTDLSQIDFNV